MCKSHVDRNPQQMYEPTVKCMLPNKYIRRHSKMCWGKDPTMRTDHVNKIPIVICMGKRATRANLTDSIISAVRAEIFWA